MNSRAESELYRRMEALRAEQIEALRAERDALREALQRIVGHKPTDLLSFEQVRELGRAVLERYQ